MIGDVVVFRWASESRAHGLPTPTELEFIGWTRVAQHPLYEQSWLMRRGSGA